MQAAIDPDTVTSVTGTAFVVAEYRAEENYAVSPLYRDDVVGLFLSAASRRASAQAAAGFPLVKELVKLRTRYFDDMLDRQIAAGCRQVVLLGSGLDTRAVRKAADGVRFFEIDDAATMHLKRYVYTQHRLDADVTFIGGNYVTDGMLPLLVANGFDVDLPTFVIWEGNTMYLNDAADRAILRQLRDNLAHVRISFDYFVPAIISRTTGDPALSRMADNFTAMNAPWVTAFADIRALAADVGLQVLEDVTTGALSRVYRPLAAPPAFGPFYAIALLGSR
ncbi:MAG: SAM-dependent methyltransferase [Vicinamibacteraceae bacterium]